MRSHHLFGAGMCTMGTLVVGYAVLGPPVLDVIHFRTSASGLNLVGRAALPVVAWFRHRRLFAASATLSRENRSRRRTVRSTSIGR